MRHAIDLYALRSAGGGAASPKEVAFNDFYYLPGDGKYGTVQSFGPMPPASAALHELAEATDGRPVLAKLLAGGRPLIRWAYQSMLCTRLVMASIMEDLPYADNGVEVDRGSADATLKITYRLHDAEVRRLARFRKHVRRAFQGLSPLVIKSGEDNRRIAHVCGTCRFGEDPQTSVLDRDNRAHAIENLYIVDASFLPSSGGTNPGLTIAANALRVADRILGRSR